MTSEELLKQLRSERQLLVWQRRFTDDKAKRHEMQVKINEYSEKIKGLRSILSSRPEFPERGLMASVETPERFY